VRWDLDNVHFLASNANVDLQRVVADLNTQHVPIQMVTIQFPDPYFKKKQHKRRVVNADLVLTLARALSPSSVVFMQSDVQDVQEWMVECFGASGYFDAAEGYNAQSLVTNASPYTIQTEREIATVNKGMPVFRMLFSRNDKHVNM
jgi:tRNA (guanine-N7-)-methyltransferase